jgi:DNA modification methylase
MATLDTESVHAAVTSPPYAMQRANQYGGIPESMYPEWTVQWMSELHRLLLPSGSVIINIREHIRNGQMSDYVHLTRLALRKWGWVEWDELLWIKKTAAPVGHPGRPRRSWERLLWFGKLPQGFASPKSNGKLSNRVGRGPSRSTRDGYQGTITGIHRSGTARCPDYVVAQPEHRQDHPAPFPVSLAEWCVRLITPPSGTVVDPFSGSGTTGVASLNQGRDFIGIEREAEYVQIARARMAAVESGPGPLFEAG